MLHSTKNEKNKNSLVHRQYAKGKTIYFVTQNITCTISLTKVFVTKTQIPTSQRLQPSFDEPIKTIINY